MNAILLAVYSIHRQILKFRVLGDIVLRPVTESCPSVNGIDCNRICTFRVLLRELERKFKFLDGYGIKNMWPVL